MILPISWLGHAAQNWLTVWTLARSAGVHSAASRRPSELIVAKPRPAALRALRRDRATTVDGLRPMACVLPIHQSILIGKPPPRSQRVSANSPRPPRARA